MALNATVVVLKPARKIVEMAVQMDVQPHVNMALVVHSVKVLVVANVLVPVALLVLVLAVHQTVMANVRVAHVLLDKKVTAYLAQNAVQDGAHLVARVAVMLAALEVIVEKTLAEILVVVAVILDVVADAIVAVVINALQVAK